MDSGVTYGYSYASENSRGVASLLPRGLELGFYLIVSAVLLAIGNINAVGELLGISSQEEFGIRSALKSGSDSFLEKIQNLPHSDIVFVFIINFLIALAIINVLSYGLSLYRNLKQGIVDATHTPSSGSVMSKVIKVVASKLFLNLFGIFWLMIFLFLLLPLGIRLSSNYLGNISNVGHILYLVFGYIIVLIGVLIGVVYGKILIHNLRK